MNVEQLAELGRQMREAQKRYFSGRDRADLEESKALEKRFDQACALVLEPDMFGGKS